MILLTLSHLPLKAFLMPPTTREWAHALGSYPENLRTLTHKDTCTALFTEASFTIAKTWKPLKCPLADDWLEKMWCTHIPWSRGWPKSKTHFPFSPVSLLNNIFTVLFHYLLLSFRQLRKSIFPKFFIFLSKELFQMPFAVFQGIETFPLENFVKTKINGNPKVQCLVNTADQSERLSQAVTVFAWSSKKHVVLLILVEDAVFSID